MFLKYPILLASQSPRRKRLLQELVQSPIRVEPVNLDEENWHHILYPQTPSLLSTIKFLKIRDLLQQRVEHRSLVIILSADTMVFLDKKSLDKPKDRLEARKTLHLLSGRTHEVITSFTIGLSDPLSHFETHSVKALVTFRSLSPEEIEAYIDTGSPFDKAGGYGYQDDLGRNFVTSLEGDETTVIGLPMIKLQECLETFRVENV